jgi:hypothetical protein
LGKLSPRRFWNIKVADKLRELMEAFPMKTRFAALAVAALALISAAQPALASSSGGNAALSLAALVGLQSPLLTGVEKTVLTKYLDGQAGVIFKKGKTMLVKADAVSCRISNVDITVHSCDLTFGGKKKTLTGRKAHEIYATLVENGVPSDGAAGSIFEGLTDLECNIDPAQVAGRDGGGASCDYAPP